METTPPDVIVAMNSSLIFKTANGRKTTIETVLAHPNSIVCPAYQPPTGGMLYAGHLDVLVPRGGGAVVLEPRWNREPSTDGKVGCVMGGVCAFSSRWQREFAPNDGIRKYSQMDLTALSLKARLSGGSCIVLKDVVVEGSLSGATPSTVEVAYGKMRLAFVTFPPEIATVVPTLLAGTPGLREATSMFMRDFRDIVRERDEFWEVCRSSPVEAAKKAGIEFGIDFKIRKVE